MKYLVVFATFLFFQVFALYEDQVAQIEWLKPLIGSIDQVESSKSSSNHNFAPIFAISSSASSLAALMPVSGEVLWRKVISDSQSFNSKAIRSLDFNEVIKIRTPEGNHADLDLFTVIDDDKNRVISGWDSLDGTLVWFKSIDKSKTFKGFEFLPAKGKKMLSLVTSNEITIYDAKQGTVLFTKETKVNDCVYVQSKGIIVYATENKIMEINLANFKEKEKLNRKLNSPAFVLVQDTIKLIEKTKGSLILTDLQDETISTVEMTEKVSKFDIIRSTKSSLLPTVFIKVNEKLIIDLNKQKTNIFVNSFDTISYCKHINDVIIVSDKYEAKLLSTSKTIKLPFINGKVKDISCTKDSFLFMFIDDSFISISMKTNEIIFKREEALTNLLGLPVSFELPISLNIKNNTNIDSNSKSDSDQILLTRLVNIYKEDKLYSLNLDLVLLRLQSQIKTITQSFINIYIALQEVLNEIFYTKGQMFINMYRGEHEPKKYTLEEKHNFGFIQVITVLAENGKLFGINTNNGNILYSKNIENFKKQNFLQTISLKAHKVAVFLTDRYIFVNGFTGEVIKTTFFKKELTQVLQVDKNFDDFVLVFNDLSIELLLDEEESHHISLKTLSSFNFLTVSKSKKQIIGRKLKAISLTLVESNEMFSLVLPNKHELLEIVEHVNDEFSSVGRHIGAGKVMVKYFNSDFVAIISESTETGYILVQILSKTNGNVFESYELESCVKESLRTVLFQNNILISCFSDDSLRTELLSVSLYFDTLFDKFELNPFKSTSKLTKVKEGEEDILVESNSFYISKRIEAFTVTNTLHAISEKRVLVVLQNGQTAMVDGRLYDPRRPTGEQISKEEKQEGLILYSPAIPIISQSIVSHKHILEGITQISTFPTKLESTCLMFATGLDLYFTRLQPSSGFDLLPEEFNFGLLIFMVIGLSIAVFFLNNAMKRKRLNELWK